MSVQIKIPTINGITLNTKNKFINDDITLVVDLPKYDGSFLNLSEEITDVLPSEYTKLYYIESTGEQYIDTEFNMTTNSEIDITMAITEYNASAKMGFLGSYESGTILYQLYASGTGNKSFYASFGGKNYVAISEFDLDTVYEINMKSNTVFVNNNQYDFTSDGLKNASIPLYLFWRNATGIKAKMRLYSCTIYNNSLAVRKFVPCTRVADGVIGLYDLVGKKFYENKGTGTFIGG